MISLSDLLHKTADVVEGLGHPYLVFGGLALPAWGSVSATQDVDILVQLSETEIQGFVSTLRSAGFSLPEGAEAAFPIDTWLTASLGGRDLDVSWGATEFDRNAIARAVRVRLLQREVPIASAEDLILYKLLAHRRKDLAHVEDVIVRQGSRLDLGYLKAWADRLAEATGRFEVPGVLRRMLEEEGLDPGP
ncbi:MAG: hypothetical protein MUC63_03515 [Planctomycetes bacterium]|jgi:hypothetical protein|nr:hypothetical protein [Planctomycetota bacterium]